MMQSPRPPHKQMTNWNFHQRASQSRKIVNQSAKTQPNLSKEKEANIAFRKMNRIEEQYYCPFLMKHKV